MSTGDDHTGGGPRPAPGPPAGGGEGPAGVRALFAGRGAGWPVLLVVTGERARAAGWTHRSLVEVARAAAQERTGVAVADLHLDEPELDGALGADGGGEGISDVVLFGSSLRRALQPVAGQPFAFVPAGFAPDPAEVLGHAQWGVVLAEAARSGGLLLLYAPAGAPGLRQLAARVGRAVLLADPAEEAEVRESLPGRFEIAAVLHAPSSAAPAAAAVAEPAETVEPVESVAAIEMVKTAEPVASAETVAPVETTEATPSIPESIEADQPETLVFTADSPEAIAVGGGAVLEAETLAPPVLAAETAPAGPPPTVDAVPVLDGASDEVVLAAAEAAVTARPEPVSARYSVPRLPAWQEWLVRAVAVATLLYGTYYVAWRWTSTLNLDALWFSIPLVLAETWGLLTAFIMVHSVWRLRHREPVPAPQGLSVDVFITSYDEPLEVIRRTAVGARAIRYPHQTWLLDDGRRDEVRALADELGIGYLRRETNADAKAGNLNHALANTGAEFVLQLDADHVPLPHILDRLLGFFALDPKLGFVQSPQDFYNTDAFTYEVSEAWRRIWEEQRLFFSVIQPGKDRTNSAFFCGSCAVFRREALLSVGGFATGTVTEDIETSLKLHAAGWGSAYYGESLAYGLAAGSAAAFHVQHLRWGQGAMQVLKRHNPLTLKGLTPAQRISYFGSLTAYVGGVQKLVFYAAPLVFFMTGALPIRAIDRAFLGRFLPFLALSFVLSELVARGTTSTWVSERYHMAKFWTYTRAVFSFFRRRPLSFSVTPKAPGHVPVRTYAPHLVLMGVTVAALGWAAVAYRSGWVEYGVPGWSSAAFKANLLWATLNFALAAAVVQHSLRIREQRGDHRFRDHFPVSVRAATRGGKPRTYLAVTEDLNPGGLAFRSGEPPEPGARLRVTLPLTTGTVQVRGRAVHVDRVEGEGGAQYRTGVQFVDVPLAVRDAIELHCIQHAVPLERARYAPAQWMARTQAWARNARRERRREVRLPARVWLRRSRAGQGGTVRRLALLAEVSDRGARLVMDEPVPPGTRLRFRVPGTDISGEGRVVFSHATETPIGVRFAIGIRRRAGGRRPPRPVPERKMSVPTLLKRAMPVLALALPLAASPAAAQLQLVAYGGAEADTEGLVLLLGGASVHTTNLGLGFGVGALAYNLTFPIGGDETETVTAVQPMGELIWRWPTASVQANVGYLFVSADDDNTGTGGGAPGGTEDGLVTSLQGNYWGTGARSAELIASYNWGGEYFWGRVRGTQRLGGGPLGVGAEVVVQGTAEDDTYRAFQAGPLVELTVSPAFRLMGVVGVKSDNRADSPSAYPYFRLDFVVIPGL